MTTNNHETTTRNAEKSGIPYREILALKTAAAAHTLQGETLITVKAHELKEKVSKK